MPNTYINRELSWLEFNQRVLCEAQREDIPLLERLKFLAITGSNLDEFFQVRVGGLTAQLSSGNDSRDIAGMTSQEQLQAIRERYKRMLNDSYDLLNLKLAPALAANDIHITSFNQLSLSQQQGLSNRFHNNIAPLLTPIAYIEDCPINLPAMQVITALELQDNEQNKRIVCIPNPDNHERFIQLYQTQLNSGSRVSIVSIEEVIAHYARNLFPNEMVTASAFFRITRNGDIVVTDDDNIEDLADEMEEMLIQRKFSDTVRLEVSQTCPPELLQTIKVIADAKENQMYPIPGIIQLSDFFSQSSISGFENLNYPSWKPQPSKEFDPHESIFDILSEGDRFLYHPYESYDPVVRLVQEAADDPDTLAIKQVLYRTAPNSKIIDALIKAAQNGKQVTVLIELKARFDEARNLIRADELQAAGVQIVYGVRNLKTHAKILLVVRNENGTLKRYTHLGTGNYNELTAKFYTDASYMTAKDSYGSDASAFFNAVTGASQLNRLNKLVPAPTEMKRTVINLIKSEANRAKAGEPARIEAKMNSLQDKDVMDALYEASRAGVKICLNIRGICCLAPGIPEHSENIHVTSVIDRYLEHARIFCFHQGGENLVYIASADWMTRNLEKRVELMIPIEDETAKSRLREILAQAFEDNSHSHTIQPNGASVPNRAEHAVFRTQEVLQEAAEKVTKSKRIQQYTTFVPHTPEEVD